MTLFDPSRLLFKEWLGQFLLVAGLLAAGTIGAAVVTDRTIHQVFLSSKQIASARLDVPNLYDSTMDFNLTEATPTNEITPTNSTQDALPASGQGQPTLIPTAHNTLAPSPTRGISIGGPAATATSIPATIAPTIPGATSAPTAIPTTRPTNAPTKTPTIAPTATHAPQPTTPPAPTATAVPTQPPAGCYILLNGGAKYNVQSMLNIQVSFTAAGGGNRTQTHQSGSEIKCGTFSSPVDNTANYYKHYSKASCYPPLSKYYAGSGSAPADQNPVCQNAHSP